jgi:hypothetical protein
MKGVWLTELVRYPLHDLSGVPWRYRLHGSLGLGYGWRVSHMGNIRLVMRPHGVAVIFKATEPTVGIRWPPPGIFSVTVPAPDLSLRLPIGCGPSMSSPLASSARVQSCVARRYSHHHVPLLIAPHDRGTRYLAHATTLSRRALQTAVYSTSRPVRPRRRRGEMVGQHRDDRCVETLRHASRKPMGLLL